MKKVLGKKLAAALMCFAVMTEPLLLTSCKDSKDSVKPADYGTYGSDIAREIAQKFPDRSAYSAGEAQTGKYIEDKIKELGFEAEVQTFTGSGGSSSNYIVKIPGTGFYCADENGVFELEHRTAIIGTHYDAALLPDYVPDEPEEEYDEEDYEEGEDQEETEPAYTYDGISDNASGTACILTALMAYKDYKDVGYDVWFIFFGAGTDNFAGAEYFYQSLTGEEKASIDVMYNVSSLYAGDKVYASSGFKSLVANKKYEMRRKLYQSYDVCFSNTLWTNYGFDLYYNESGVKADINEDGIEDIFKEMPNTVSDFKVFDDHMIPVVYFESYEYNFTRIDQMKETKNLSLQDYNGNIRRTPADSTKLLDSVLIEEDKDRDGDGEIDCTGDILQIRINCVAFIIDESLLKGSDKGMTPKEYETYRVESTRQTYMSESTVASAAGI